MLIETPARILLVEDHPATQRRFVKLLTQAGYRVVSAGTCAAARRWLRQEPFTAVVTDYHLPDGTGTRIIKLVHDLHLPTRTVLMSTDADIAFLARVSQADAVYDKGDPVDLLLSTLAHLMA